MAGAQTIPVKERFNAGEEVQYELYFKWGILMPRAGQATLSIKDTRYEDNPAYHYNLLFRTSGMFETSMVAILVAAMCALIRENGGFDVLLNVIHRIFRGKRGGQFGVGLLVTLLDIATANNTVAIVMANPIAKEISEDYGISARKTASLLDTFSCISQGILPYGAQMLVALSAVHELGYELSAFEVMPLLFYPGMLFISSLICIFLLPERGNRAKAKK